MKVTQILLAAGIMMAASSAQAVVTVYNFSSYADGTNLSGLDVGGLTLDGGRVNGGVVSSSAAISGVFNMFGVINIGLDISGDAFLNAFAPGGASNGGVSGNSGSLGLFAPNTASISFGSAGSFTFDNLSVETINVSGGNFGPGETSAPAIPVPGALPLMATALAGVAYLGTRRRRS